jgi:hypothetical protein
MPGGGQKINIKKCLPLCVTAFTGVWIGLMKKPSSTKFKIRFCFSFFNKYAGQKSGSTATNACVHLKMYWTPQTASGFLQAGMVLPNALTRNVIRTFITVSALMGQSLKMYLW